MHKEARLPGPSLGGESLFLGLVLLVSTPAAPFLVVLTSLFVPGVPINPIRAQRTNVPLAPQRHPQTKPLQTASGS